MRLVIIPGGYTTRNHGDTAMLMVALERIRQWSNRAEVFLVSDEPGSFRKYSTELVSIAPGTLGIFSPQYIDDKVSRVLLGHESNSVNSRSVVGGVRHSVTEACRILGASCPRSWTRLLRAMTALPAIAAPHQTDFASAVMSADAVIVTGAGYLNDEFEDHALCILGSLDAAIRQGKPVYLFGKGVGPMASLGLLGIAAKVLPRVRRICVREKLFSVPLLQRLGVEDSRVVVTGDDAIALALAGPPLEDIGDGLGFNVRLAGYSATSLDAVTGLGAAVRATAAALGAPLRFIPISLKAGEHDFENSYASVYATRPPADALLASETPVDVIKTVRQCRVVVAGSYHAAVFALSVGAPCIAVFNSEYYRTKFLGLADQFTLGCRVVALDQARAVVPDLIRKLWNEAPQLAPLLRERANQQQLSSSAEYLRVGRELNGKGS